MLSNLFAIIFILAFLPSCSFSPHGGLEGREVGVNVQYRQNNKPTEAQRKDGEAALRRWKKASPNNQYFFADQIVKGQVLIGMTKKEVDILLGEAPLVVREPVENGPMSEYMLWPPFSSHESSAHLVAKYGKDGKVNNIFIDVNR